MAVPSRKIWIHVGHHLALSLLRSTGTHFLFIHKDFALLWDERHVLLPISILDMLNEIQVFLNLSLSRPYENALLEFPHNSRPYDVLYYYVLTAFH